MRSMRALICVSLPLVAGLLHGQSDLSTAGLEELMNIQVTSASRKPQSMSQVAAAMYVLSGDEIRRSGATSIPDALRWVPGLDVAQVDSNKWAISARGFNKLLANKMLVLLDGRSLYGADFSGVFWDLHDTLIEDIDRIEIIRGPGATMWGSNAVNGVINIITRHSKETRGGIANARAGNYERGGVAARYGFAAGARGHARVWGKHSARGTLRVEGPLTVDTAWDTSRAGFRSDWELGGRSRLMVQGDMYRADRGLNWFKTSLTPPYSSVQGRGLSTGSSILGRWSTSHEDLSQTSLQIYHQNQDSEQGVVHTDSGVTDAAFQRQQFLGSRHDLQYGGNVRTSRFDFKNTFSLSIKPAQIRHNLSSAFVQDEIQLIEGTLNASAGLELEHNTYTGVEVQPAVHVLWTPTRRSTVWAALSRAVRTPSITDANADVNFSVLPNDIGLTLVRTLATAQFRSETLLASEAGWRSEWRNNFATDVSVYYNRYSDLASTTIDPPVVRTDVQPILVLIDARNSNGAWGYSYGAEVSSRLQVREWWRTTVGYSYLAMNLRTSTNNADYTAAMAGSSPQNRGFVQFSFALPRAFELDVQAARTGKLLSVPAYTRVDARLGWAASETVSFSLAAQNLVGPAHVEFDGLLDGVPARSRVGRTAYGQVSWRF